MIFRVFYIGIVLSVLSMHVSGSDVITHKSMNTIDSCKVSLAEGIVRQWPNLRTNAKLVLRKIRRSKPVGGYARFVLDAPDENQTFGVDIESGEVDYWRENDYKPCKEGQAAHHLSEDVIAEKALAFVKAHYRGFAQSGLNQKGTHLFQRRLDNGVMDAGLVVAVDIDSCTGEVYSYRVYRDSPICISTDAKVSKETAEATAVSIYSGMPAFDTWSAVRSAFVVANYGLCVERDDIGLQRLVWSIGVITSSDASLTLKRYLREKDRDVTRFITSDHAVLVDALTGEVAYADGYEMKYILSGMSKRSAKSIPPSARNRIARFRRLQVVLHSSEDSPLDVNVPPLLIDGVPYLYARSVAALLGRNVVAEDSNRVVIGGCKPLELKLDPKVVPIGKAKRPMKVLFGRLYVPLDTVNRLFDCSIKWKKQDGILIFPDPT